MLAGVHAGAPDEMPAHAERRHNRLVGEVRRDEGEVLPLGLEALKLVVHLDHAL